MRIAIVTGGSRDAARRLADRGYGVVVVYLRDPGAAEAMVEEILAADGSALAVRADVADELDVARLFEETAEAFGGVDVIVHTAVRNTAVIDREAARRLRRGGAIVNVSTAAAIEPALADELCARDITVNGLVPGLEAPGADHRIDELIAFLDYKEIR